MSILVAMMDGPGKFVVGSDGRTMAGDHIDTDDSAKWVIGHGVAVGSAGSRDLFDLLCHEFGIPSSTSVNIREFTKRLRTLLEESWSPFEKEGSARAWEVELLVITTGMLYEVTSTLRITERRRYAAIGSGYQYALGALLTLSTMNFSAEEDVSMAIGAALQYDSRCGGREQIQRIKSPLPVHWTSKPDEPDPGTGQGQD